MCVGKESFVKRKLPNALMIDEMVNLSTWLLAIIPLIPFLGWYGSWADLGILCTGVSRAPAL